mmetsp:Transcript_12475/g.30588  ORF Transcript_12475/g.30588 Transcript_12475/m.30588 type:complete len:165 (-) Transcript_12475:202-696(-)
MRRPQVDCDVRAAFARVVAPPPRHGLDDSTMSGSQRPPDSLAAATPSITHVPNVKLPFPLGSPPWSAGRAHEGAHATVRPRAMPASAPKVCSSAEQQPIADASQYGRVSLGPQTYSFASRQKRWNYTPPPGLLMRWRGEDAGGTYMVAIGALVAAAACVFFTWL